MELAEVSIEPVTEHLDVYRRPFDEARVVVLRDYDPWIVGVAEDMVEWECRWALASVGFHNLLGSSLLGMAAGAQHLLPACHLTAASREWCSHEMARQACVPVALVRARMIALGLVGQVDCDHGDLDLRQPQWTWTQLPQPAIRMLPYVGGA